MFRGYFYLGLVVTHKEIRRKPRPANKTNWGGGLALPVSGSLEGTWHSCWPHSSHGGCEDSMPLVLHL